ncbi:MAG: Oxygen-independent coproporphyrinogen III oxidase [Marinimicrobia bacterium 46_47]|nr:MAG: Oxygen-independent coproporphyrinogen III oxidase [Marinimicrobia bacterium 46_47]
MGNPGIYIHIPFCLNKCPYCDFFSQVAKEDEISLFLHQLQQEIKNKAPLYTSYAFDTVYIGGGTPNCLESSALLECLAILKQELNITSDAEITLELNPECIVPEDLKAYEQSGINRLSLGTQSFRNEELRFLGRIHNAKKNLEALHLIRAFNTFSLACDVITGLPGQSVDDLQVSLDLLQKFSPEHLSVYILTAEEGTPYYQWIQEDRVKPLEEEQVNILWKFAHHYLQDRGYSHYEVSNFAKPEYHSRHNSKYWDDSNYLGFGPSAHSRWDRTRFWNPPDLKSYLDGTYQPVYETINDEQWLIEQLMLELRTEKGFDLNYLSFLKHSQPFFDMISRLNSESETKLLEIEGNFLKATPEGWILLDSMIEKLIEKIDC